MNTTFEDLGIPSEILAVLSKRGYKTPFDIQIATIPDALAGRDICGRAATGSGKTLAFGIPLAVRVGKARPHFPRGLVLAPTRELAEQIQRELTPLAMACGRTVVSVYGGVGYEPQRRAFRKAVDILVACPGRLADLVEQGDVHLDEVEHVVIDEADRMADMGFLPEVKRLLDRTAKDRQTVMFSATLDNDVAVITRLYQRDPVHHQVGELEPDIEAAQHHFWRVAKEDRQAVTESVVRKSGQTIVFSRTRHGADRIAKNLASAGIDAAAIHGRRTQGQRNRALDDFSRGKVQVLVATDVAARGIHVDGVHCVLHFDLPEDGKAYLHRSGRTARAGETGVVVTLVMNDQLADLYAIQYALSLNGRLGSPTPELLFGPDRQPLTAPMNTEPLRRPGSSNGGASGNGNGNRNGNRSGSQAGQSGARPGGQRRRGYGSGGGPTHGSSSGTPSRPAQRQRRRQPAGASRG